MTTSALIDLIVEYIGSELTRVKILEYLNDAQNELLVWNNRLMRILPDPFLTTVDGTFEYVASTSIFKSTEGVKGTTQFDIANVAKIYSFTKQTGFFNGYGILGFYGNSVSNKRYYAQNERTSGEVIAPADTTKSIEPNSQDCLITWWEENDPGNTTIDWRCECYRYPAQLTSEKIALSTPSQYQGALLLWLVLKRLGIRQYGSTNIDQLILPAERKFKNYIKSGNLSDSKFTSSREV